MRRLPLMLLGCALLGACSGQASDTTVAAVTTAPGSTTLAVASASSTTPTSTPRPRPTTTTTLVATTTAPTTTTTRATTTTAIAIPPMTTTTAPPRAVVTVTASNFSFSPASVTVAAGDSVQWVSGSGSHTTTSGTPASPDGRWDQTITAPVLITFSQAGTYNFFCRFHPDSMQGSVVVP